MTAQKVSSFKLQRVENLRELSGCSGLCLTAYLPPFLPGQKGREAPAAMLRNFAQEAESRLTGFGASKARIAALLDPIAQLAANPAATEGFHWPRAILRSPEVFEEFVLREPVPSGLTVSGRFDLLPLVPEAELPAEYYLLKISKKNAALERASFSAEQVKLPDSAGTIDDFLEMDYPDHDLENRMASGGPYKVRFGTGADRGTEHLADYYRFVDQTVSKILRPKNAVAVLVGVEEDTSLFRSVSSMPELLADSIRPSGADDGSSTSAISSDALLSVSLRLIREKLVQRNAKACASAKERFAPARYAEDPDSIVKMASMGRVAWLYVPEDARGERLNEATIQTLIHGGEVHALPAGEPAGAALRY